jgi:hypothetical protein
MNNRERKYTRDYDNTIKSRFSSSESGLKLSKASAGRSRIRKKE